MSAWTSMRRAVVPLASGIAYALTAARYVQGGDSGELAAVGAMGGIAHPPGYPLFVLWCRLWSWLPAPPAHGMALATAIAGALAVFMLERAAEAWGARPLAASLAAAMFAFSPLAWRLSTEPEVFMLNAALALGLLIIGAPRPCAREDRRAVALAFVAGLGISNHHSIILLAPLGLYAWGRSVARTDRRAAAIFGSIGALGLGLLPYLYLLGASDSACVWGDTSSLDGLLHHFLRRDYGTTQLAVADQPPEPLGQLRLLGITFLESGVAITGVLALVALGKRRAWTAEMLALLATLVLAGPLFVSRFNLPPRDLMALVVVRFHLLPLAIASVVASLGVDAVMDGVRTPLARRVILGATVVAVVGRAVLSGTDVVAHHRPTTERYLRNVFAIVPPRSVILASGDDAVGGFEFMQCVLGERPDVVVISPQLMLSGSYGRRTSRKLGFAVTHGVVLPGDDTPTLDAGLLIEQLMESDRPVFLSTWFRPQFATALPSYPVGPLIRLAREQREVPSPTELLRQNEAVFETMTLDESPPRAHTWAGARYVEYARPWLVLAQAFDKIGESDLSRACRERALRLRPVEAPSF